MATWQTYALMHGGCIYTLRAWKDPWGRKSPFKWRGYCDGQPCGLFRTKADFEAFVEREPEQAPLGPHGSASLRAETWSTFEGNQLLHRFLEGNRPT